MEKANNTRFLYLRNGCLVGLELLLPMSSTSAPSVTFVTASPLCGEASSFMLFPSVNTELNDEVALAVGCWLLAVQQPYFGLGCQEIFYRIIVLFLSKHLVASRRKLLLAETKIRMLCLRKPFF